MASNQDARPFVDLQKDADEFQAKFEEDIKRCKSFLDCKITSLICEPDSFGNLVGSDQNPLMQFSRAKYAIFISVKNLMNDYEKQWVKYLNEMKKLYLENVEIFLAGTKLEVKLPSSESQSLDGSKKSPGNKRTSSVTSALYPIFSSVTKSLPVLSSPLRSNEVQRTTPDETESVSPQQKSASWKMEMDDIELDLNTSCSSGKSRRSVKVDSSGASQLSPRQEIKARETKVLPTQNFSSEEEKSGSSMSRGRGCKRQSAAQNRKLKTNGIILQNVSSSESQEEASEVKSAINSSRLLKGRRLQSKQSTLNQENDLDTNNKIFEDSEETDRIEPKMSSSQLLNTRKRRGKQSALNNLEDIGTKSTLTEDSEETSEVEQKPSRLNSRKSTLNASSRSSRNIASKVDTKMSDENETDLETEVNNILPTKGRRGKQAAKVKDMNKSTVSFKENNIKEVICEEPHATAIVSETRRGRSAVTKNAENSDISLNKTTRMTGRSAGRKTISERISDSEASVSPKKVPFTEEDSDDLDLYNPVTKPSKSALRRKTLLPDMNEAASSTEIFSGNSTRGRSKRKTISGVPDLASVAPSKRLKTSGNKKNDPIVEDDGATVADNLLENNDGYSEWVVLKNVDGKTPTSPAIYEVKVWRAKKPAYIGTCESLRQTLTLHKLRQNSGHKHLDKFIERNYNDIQIRYEVVSSLNAAKVEVKNRINNFVAQHKTTPAYN